MHWFQQVYWSFVMSSSGIEVTFYELWRCTVMVYIYHSPGISLSLKECDSSRRRISVCYIWSFLAVEFTDKGTLDFKLYFLCSQITFAIVPFNTHLGCMLNGPSMEQGCAEISLVAFSIIRILSIMVLRRWLKTMAFFFPSNVTSGYALACSRRLSYIFFCKVSVETNEFKEVSTMYI